MGFTSIEKAVLKKFKKPSYIKMSESEARRVPTQAEINVAYQRKENKNMWKAHLINKKIAEVSGKKVDSSAKVNYINAFTTAYSINSPVSNLPTEKQKKVNKWIKKYNLG